MFHKILCIIEVILHCGGVAYLVNRDLGIKRQELSIDVVINRNGCLRG
jgi:hypothetical protein